MKKFKTVIAVLALSAALFTGCGTSDKLCTEPNYQPGESYLTREESQNPVQTALCSAVRITCSFSRLYRGNVISTASAGAGVIYALDAEAGDAYILTNYHVVYNADSLGQERVAHVSDDISVWLYGGGEQSGRLSATFVGGAMDYDVALLRIEGSDVVKTADGAHTNAEVLSGSAARPVSFGDSDELYAGKRVYAVGNPEANGISATEGIVSVEAEYITMQRLNGSGTVSMLEIRTDAAINHGNSGGGLFDETGAFVGLVNARSEASGVEAFGYAIPSNLVGAVAENVLAGAKAGRSGALRATLGVTLQTSASEAVRDGNRLRIVETLVVENVTAGSAAEGLLRKGDILVSVSLKGEKTQIYRLHMLTVSLFKVRQGDKLAVTVLREGRETSITISFDNAAYFTLFA